MEGKDSSIRTIFITIFLSATGQSQNFGGQEQSLNKLSSNISVRVRTALRGEVALAVENGDILSEKQILKSGLVPGNFSGNYLIN